MLEVGQIKVEDTTLRVDVYLDLKGGASINMEVLFQVEFSPDELIVTPFQFGSVIGRDQNKTLALANCDQHDTSGNPLSVLQKLGKVVEIDLDQYPDEDSLAIWNIKKALLAYFEVPGTTIPDQQWIGVTIKEIIDQSFPAGVLAK